MYLERLKAINWFLRKAPSQKFDCFLNTPLNFALHLDRLGQSNQFGKKSKIKLRAFQKLCQNVFKTSSESTPRNALKTSSSGGPCEVGLGRPWKVRLGYLQNVRLGRPWDVGSTLPQIASSGHILEALDGGILRIKNLELSWMYCWGARPK